ncbi:MAG: hypothetical protein HYW23_02550 [Candidatus Aenigmarchaeota archaeon]|nr:hypothetical protein [Candidatus Aenigmarchaeota archaeon]
MAQAKDLPKIRSKAITFFTIGMIGVIADVIVPSILLKLVAEFVYLVAFIITIVYSIKLIRRKSYGLGITFLVISSLGLLLLLIGFIVGFIVGLTRSL